jgi:hypothetical protein
MSDTPEPGIARLRQVRAKGFGTQALQLKMLGQQLHAFVPANRVR